MKTIKQYMLEVKQANLDSKQYALKKWKENNKEHPNNNAITRVIKLDSNNNEIKKSIFNNVPFAVKANIAIENNLTDGGSQILSNFKPPYSATIIKKLQDQFGAIPLFQTNMDELGQGGFGIYSFYGSVHNPYNKELMIGGSSSGSAYLVARGIVPFAVGTDTGDSIRLPAANAGIVGYKPTWGLVSRYGVYDYCPSLDTVGWYTNSIEDSVSIYNALIGKDENDFSSTDLGKSIDLNKIDLSFIKNKKIFYPKNFFTKVVDENIKIEFEKIITFLKQNGAKIINDIEFDDFFFNGIKPMYSALSFAEGFSSNLNLTGISFGKKVDGKNWEELISKTRAEGFGFEIKKRFLIGAWSLREENIHQVFEQAKKARSIAIKYFDNLFSKYDLLILPSTSELPSSLKEIEKRPLSLSREWHKDFLTLQNILGSPSIVLPTTKVENGNGLRYSISIAANHFEDEKVFSLAKLIESEINNVKR